MGDVRGYDGGVYKSTDGGSTWSAANTGLPASPKVSALAINPKTPTTLYAAAQGWGGDYPGVYKSTDGGGTWGALPITHATVFAIDPQTPTTLYAGGYYGLFKSTDGGDSWSETGDAGGEDDGYAGTVYALAIDPQTPTTLYVLRELCYGCGPGVSCCHRGGVFKSTDGGDTWNAFGTGLSDIPVLALAIDPIEPRRVYAGTEGGGVFAIEQAQVVGTGTPASCTETALDAALAPGGLVTFDCGGAPVTITITSTKTISLDTTIDGGGSVTISGGHAVGVFAVDSGVTFDVRNLTIADGNAGVGGGILNLGTLTLTNSTLSGNSAGLLGGGGILNGGTATLMHCTLSGNSAGYGRRGVGGGIWNAQYGTLTLTNSTLSGNSAGYGGGIANAPFCPELCGIDPCGSVVVTNGTFSGNSADAGAGAIDSPCPASVTSSIIASPSAVNCSGGITDGGHNLQFPGTSCGAAIPSLDPLLDPVGLKDNGGPTQTIALLPGSPAINAGDTDVCVNPPVNGVDQRGYARPGSGHTRCSIGAYEADAVSPEPCVGDCDGTGSATIDELITLVNIALGTAQASACPHGVPSGAEVNVALILQAVNNALSGCGVSPAEQGCLTSGGTVTSAMCCAGTSDFPDTCAIGACGCAPAASHEVRVCACAAGCFDGNGCVRQ